MRAPLNIVAQMEGNLLTMQKKKLHRRIFPRFMRNFTRNNIYFNAFGEEKTKKEKRTFVIHPLFDFFSPHLRLIPFSIVNGVKYTLGFFRAQFLRLLVCKWFQNDWD